MKKYETIKQLESLTLETYIYGIIIAIVALFIAYFAANLIKWGGKNSTDHVKRRIWFIGIGVTFLIVFFLYNSIYVSQFITKAPFQAKFTFTNFLASFVLTSSYFGIGIVSMLIFRNSKWGSILGKSK